MPTYFRSFFGYSHQRKEENDRLRGLVQKLQAEVKQLKKTCKEEYKRGYNDAQEQIRRVK